MQRLEIQTLAYELLGFLEPGWLDEIGSPTENSSCYEIIEFFLERQLDMPMPPRVDIVSSLDGIGSATEWVRLMEQVKEELFQLRVKYMVSELTPPLLMEMPFEKRIERWRSKDQ